jgi:acyl-CoA thioesterase
MSSLSEALDVFDVRPVDDGHYSAVNLPDGPGRVVFGGQLLAQSLLAASKTVADKQVLSMHTIFLQGASVSDPLDLRVDTLHQGRSFATVSVAISQDDIDCATSLVLMHAPDEDVIRHQTDPPTVEPAEDLIGTGHSDWWDVRVCGGVDVRDPNAIGPPRLQLWSRVPDAPDDIAMNQALLAFATDGFLIGTAMRPHEGVGQSLAHVSIATTVLAHTLTFHEPFKARDWLLLDHHSVGAGRGRSHGLGDVFESDGRLVCSFSQDNMIRNLPEQYRPSTGEKSRF